MYLAVIYLDLLTGVVRRIHAVVSVILKIGLCLGHLKVISPHLLGIEHVKLIFGEVVHDARPVRIADNID